MSNELQKDGLSVKIYGAGNADWFRNVLAPLQDELLAVVPRHLGEIPLPLRQRMTRSEPEIMNAWGMVLVAGVTLYVARKAGKVAGKYFEKALDEGYDVVLKPRIRKLWKGLDKMLIGANKKHDKAFLVSIWYEELNVLVTVAVIGATFDDIIGQLDLMHQVHTNALTWIASHGVSAPVHHYLLQDGKVNAEPLFFEREEEVVKSVQ
jgi:hypothetical protein